MARYSRVAKNSLRPVSRFVNTLGRSGYVEGRQSVFRGETLSVSHLSRSRAGA